MGGLTIRGLAKGFDGYVFVSRHGDGGEDSEGCAQDKGRHTEADARQKTHAKLPNCHELASKQAKVQADHRTSATAKNGEADTYTPLPRKTARLVISLRVPSG